MEVGNCGSGISNDNAISRAIIQEGRITRTQLRCGPSFGDIDPQTLIIRLRSDLDAERGNVKQLRCEKERAIREARDIERYRASIALKELRSRTHKEKHTHLVSISIVTWLGMR